MTVHGAGRVVYGLLGVLYLLLGVGSIVLPLGLLPPDLVQSVLAGETLNDYFEHFVQEFGTVVLAVGFVFLWCARLPKIDITLHWALTFYFALDMLIHWVSPDGVISTWQRGVTNTVPFAVMLLLGVLLSRSPRQASGTA